MTHPLRRGFHSLVLALALALPAPAFACAVCGGGNPANRFAFFASTIALSLLPLGLFVAAFLWVRARLRARGSSEFVERDPLAMVPRSTLLEPPNQDPGDPTRPPMPAR
jgi:hypothetical protein